MRLDAQKYTLVLWRRAWETKASAKKPTGGTIENGYRLLWGEEGYPMVIKSLAQLNLYFGEAFRALKSIDPESFEPLPSGLGGDEQVPSENPHMGKGGTSKHLMLPSPGSSEGDSTSTKERSSWYRRLSPSGPRAIWRRKSVSPALTPPEGLLSPEEKARLAREALQQKLSPGTKFKWSVSLKEKIRGLIADIDD